MLKLPLSDYWKDKPYKPTDPDICHRVSKMALPDDDGAETLAIVLGFISEPDPYAFNVINYPEEGEE